MATNCNFCEKPLKPYVSIIITPYMDRGERMRFCGWGCLANFAHALDIAEEIDEIDEDTAEINAELSGMV